MANARPGPRPRSLAGEAPGPGGFLPKILPDKVLPAGALRAGAALRKRAPEQELVVALKRPCRVARVRGRLRGQREVAGGQERDLHAENYREETILCPFTKWPLGSA